MGQQEAAGEGEAMDGQEERARGAERPGHVMEVEGGGGGETNGVEVSAAFASEVSSLSCPVVRKLFMPGSETTRCPPTLRREEIPR